MNFYKEGNQSSSLLTLSRTRDTISIVCLFNSNCARPIGRVDRNELQGWKFNTSCASSIPQQRCVTYTLTKWKKEGKENWFQLPANWKRATFRHLLGNVTPISLLSEHILCKESIVIVKKFDFEIFTFRTYTM